MRLSALTILRTATLSVATLTAGLPAGAAAKPQQNTPSRETQASPLKGMASLTGTVRASKPFEYAQVYFSNKERGVMYMVYATDGRFRAVAMFPGNYEVIARAKGMASSAIQHLALTAGTNKEVDIEMMETSDPNQPAALTDNNFPSETEYGGVGTQKARSFANYDEIYPDGPGKLVAEQVCMVCHGENFLPGMPATAEVWQERLDFMMGKNLVSHDRPTGGGEGFLAPPASMWRFGIQDRKDVLAYLVKNFGPDASPRAVRTAVPPPIDKAKLAKAEYIEYSLPEKAGGNLRHIHGMDFDKEGNVWGIDAQKPSTLFKIDPRTGRSKEFPLPDPEGGSDEVVGAPTGMLWIPQFLMGQQALKKPPRLLYGFNIKTEKWEKQINLDPEGDIRAALKTPYTPTLDSKGNVYVGWIVGDALSKVDPKTDSVTVYRIPFPNAAPYGVVTDKHDQIWMGLYNAGGLMKFDPVTNAFTTFAPPTFPAYVRRGPSVDIHGNIWSGIYAAGKRPGKLIRLDGASGKFTEWTIPHQNARPYSTGSDAEGNIWFVDDPSPDRGASYGKFDPKAQTFTFYPKPHFAETSPYALPTAGGMWYTPRQSGIAGVLYPDMDKITSLAAYPLP